MRRKRSRIIAARPGSAQITVQGDMASEDDITRVFADVDSQLGRLTHLVNNAGITGRASRLDDAPTGEIRRTIDLNVTGAILVAREAIRRMSPRHGGNGGSIVNLSSAAVWLGAPKRFRLVCGLQGRDRRADDRAVEGTRP